MKSITIDRRTDAGRICNGQIWTPRLGSWRATDVVLEPRGAGAAKPDDKGQEVRRTFR